MSDYRYIQTIRDQLVSGKVMTKASNIASTLMDEAYPHLISKVEMDSVSGDNYADLKKTLKTFLKKLGAKVKVAKVIGDTFQLHRTFRDVKNRDIVYIPLTIEFDDGQTLTGLARQYGSEISTKLSRTEFIKITRWFLNEQDITKLVYKTRADIADEAKAVTNIASIINFTSARFLKENPQVTEEQLQALRDELAALEKEIEVLKASPIKDPDLVPEVKKVPAVKPVLIPESPVDTKAEDKKEEGEQTAKKEDDSQKRIDELIATLPEKKGYQELIDAIDEVFSAADDSGTDLSEEQQNLLEAESDRLTSILASN